MAEQRSDRRSREREYAQILLSSTDADHLVQLLHSRAGAPAELEKGWSVDRYMRLVQRTKEHWHANDFVSDEAEYVFLFRFVNLMLVSMKRHPQYAAARYATSRRELRLLSSKVMDRLEILKSSLKENFEAHKRKAEDLRRSARKPAVEKAGATRRSEAPRSDSLPVTLNPLSNERERNIDFTRRETLSDDDVACDEELWEKQRSGTSSGFDGRAASGDTDAQPVLARESVGLDAVADVRQRWDDIFPERSAPTANASFLQPGPSLYMGDMERYSKEALRAESSEHVPTIQAVPFPPVEHGEAGARVTEGSIEAPLSFGDARTHDKEPSSAIEDRRMSMSDAGRPLRQLNLPSALLQRFANLARANTQRGIETCALLCGEENGDSYRASALVVPPQHGTSDSCHMEGEDLIVDCQISNNLITLGWIHTHPTQSCFLSSVDVHTQCGYQSMLPEAVAIVLSEPEKRFGFFRLSEPDGLRLIQQCNGDGFHAHRSPTGGNPNSPGGGIFEECTHVVVNESLACVVYDLR